jgi:predicted DNA-binding transcriptional regulator YafY
MRRADRLFQIIEVLRRSSTVTAAELAVDLEVSERTIYRDVADLTASGVPIEGEAGVGYALKSFDLPPVMFDRDEIEALALGMRMVRSFGDSELEKAAARVLGKIEAVLPDDRRAYVEGTPLFAHSFRSDDSAYKFDLATLRHAIRDRRYAELDYSDAAGASTQRRVRPLGMAFFGVNWLLMAWCELREDFRAFRPDRMQGLRVLDETFEVDPPKEIATYVAKLQAEFGTCSTEPGSC